MSGTSPITGRSRANITTAVRFGLVVALASLVVVLASPGPVAAATDGAAAADGGVVVEEAAPDVVVLAPEGATAEQLADAVAGIAELRGVAWAAADTGTGPRALVVVSFDDDAGDTPLDTVRDSLDDGWELGGRAVGDQAVSGRVARGVTVGLLLAALAMTALVTVLTGWFRGVLAGAVMLLAPWVGGLIGASVAGVVDGSLATTPIPGAVAGAVVVAYIVIRSLIWFESPSGVDPAEMVRRCVAGTGQEVAVTGIGLLAAAVLLEPIGPGRSLVGVALVGALTAAVLAYTLVPTTLAVVEVAGADGRIGSLVERTGHRTMTPPIFPFTGPGDRRLPPVALAGVSVVLALLALASFQGTGSGGLLDGGPLGGDDGVDAHLSATMGDPSAAIVARFDDGVDQLAKVAWLEQISALDGVARVDSSVGRHRDGQLTGADPAAIGLPEAAAASDEAPRYALVVPVGPGRSEAAQDLASRVDAAAGPVVRLAGEPVDALGGAGRDRSVVWFTLVILAVVAGAAGHLVLGDPVVALVVGGFRLVESMGLVGLYHLLTGSPTGAEIQLLVIVAAIGAGLFEVGFLRRLLHGHRTTDTGELLTTAVSRDGLYAVLALALAVPASLGLVAAGLGTVGRFGVVTAVALGLQLVAGLWLLRPTVLGDRAVASFAAQPVANALRALGRDGTEPDRFRWNEVVAELLTTELACQHDPSGPGLDRVYVVDSASHREAVEQNDRLAAAGLRVEGAAPIVRSVTLIADGPPVAVTVEVDHPARQLIVDDGSVVGVRRPERRSVMLWLAAADDGHRIAETIELGTAPVAEHAEPVPTTTGPAAGTVGGPGTW